MLKWIKKYWRLLLVIGLTILLIILDGPPIGEIPKTTMTTQTVNTPFGGAGTGSGITSQPSPANVPPTTILQYAFQHIETSTNQEDIKKILLPKAMSFC